MHLPDYSKFGSYYDYLNHRGYIDFVKSWIDDNFKKAKPEKIEPNPQKA